MHNGFIERFRQTLYRPIRDRLSDEIYQSIHGTTDSEHIFALLVNELQTVPDASLEKALSQTLIQLTQLAESYHVNFSANVIISDGHSLVASRYASGSSAPTLYWVRDDPNYPNAVLIASEPLFAGNWHSCPTNSLLVVKEDLDLRINQF
ncbi:MAG: class II glutamine amidotransferase [Coleofasciculus chthonoplastes F3-SA18-01]|uniref:class II glutamine amidotransferase n=1 Tax=Coleofasciculus chthonoplastes TaxID=64178 RepID=UPI003300BC7D